MPVGRRFQGIEQRTDNNIEDDPAGIYRAQLAAASKERKAAEAAELARKNAEHRERLKNVKASTDDQLDTEAAAMMRNKMAAASRARLAAENEARRQHAREMTARIDATGPATDNQMDTEAAAIARSELAAKSKARKAARDARREQQNQELQNKIKNVAARTDNMMDTEEAALARAVLAAESSERRRQYALETSRRNAAMKQRIKDAQDENGWDEDAAAVCELVARRELKRDSDVSKQSYIKYKSYLEKLEMGDEIRRERKQNEMQKKQDLEDQLLRVQQFVARGHRESEEMREFMLIREQLIAAAGKTQRDREAKYEQQRLRDKRRYASKMKKRVAEQKSLNTRLAASEASQDAMMRREAGIMRLQIMDALKKSREDEERALREQAASAREARSEALRKKSARTHRERTHRVREQRQEEAMRRFDKEDREQEYLDSARYHRSDALATRSNAKRAADDLVRQKTAEAQRIRSITNEVFSFDRAAAATINLKKKVADAYATRYVDSDKASEWLSSPLHNLHVAVRNAMEWASAKAKADKNSTVSL